MGFLNTIGKFLVTIRRIIAVVILIVFIVAIFTPIYKVSFDPSKDTTATTSTNSTTNVTTTTPLVNECTTLYNSFYIYDTDNGLQIWDYNTDNMGTIIVLGIGLCMTLFSCLVLALTAIRANRGRILSIIVFGVSLLAVIEFFFIPIGWNTNQTYCGNTLPKNDGPADSIWGSSDNGGKWGAYWGWYILMLGCFASLGMFVIGLISPNPEEKEEYTPITNSANDYYK